MPDPLNKHRTIFRWASFVVLAAFIVLAGNVRQYGIGAAYTDPVGMISAVDEATYVNCTIRMSQDGDWLTPKVWGRLFLQKPPLLFWLSALSIKLFGTGLLTIRLPALLLGAVTCGAVFLWCAYHRSLIAGGLAAAMLVTSPIFLTQSRLVYTDILSAGFITLAMAAVALDPSLERRRTRICLGLFTGGAILSKSIAGLLPLLTLLIWWLASPARSRPRFFRLIEGSAMAIVVAAPWHLYQYFTHRSWFLADYVELTFFRVGMQKPLNGYFNQPTAFYAQRLWQLDPILTVFAVIGLFGTIRSIRSRERTSELLLFCWMTVTILALASFQAKNLPYVTMLLPPLCIMGGLYVPRKLILASFLLLPLKSHPVSPPIPGVKAIREYYNLNRDAELIAVETDDHFYSATIPLPHPRYAWVDPLHNLSKAEPYYVPLGIMLTTEEFLALPSLRATYERRLRDWGENSPEPIGTAIQLNSPADLTAIIEANPGADFYLPANWQTVIGQANPTHQVIRYSDERAFLLSRTAGLRKKPLQPIPPGW